MKNQPFILYNETKMRVRNKVLKRLKKPVKFSLKQIDEMIVKAFNSSNNLLMWGIGASMSGKFCGQCGLCCRRCHPIYLDAEDIQRISQYLGIPLNEFYLEYVDVNEDTFCIKDVVPCQFLNCNNRCSIYPVRPSVCKFYPFNIDPTEKGEAIVFEIGCKIPENMLVFTTLGLLVQSILPPDITKLMQQKAEHAFKKMKEKSGSESETVLRLVSYLRAR